MTASISTPTDLINNSLTRIGFKKLIGNPYDGSEAGKTALEVYAQTRDEMLRSDDMLDFAERNATLNLLKQAPAGGYINVPWTSAYPPLPWLFEYTYPSDCLKLRSIRPQPGFTMDFDPQPFVTQIANDNAFTPPEKVILCNVPNALIVYTGQITDLTTWEADAIEAFSAKLGVRLGPRLMGLNTAKLAAQDAQQASATADMEQG